MGRRFNYQRAARALVDAVLLGDEKAAEKHDISVRSLQRYRNRVEEDDKLSNIVAGKINRIHEKRDDAWVKEIPEALQAGVSYLLAAAEQLEDEGRFGPDDIHSVAGFVKILAEVSVGWKIIDAKLRAEDGAGDQEGRETVPGEFRQLPD